MELAYYTFSWRHVDASVRSTVLHMTCQSQLEANFNEHISIKKMKLLKKQDFLINL